MTHTLWNTGEFEPRVEVQDAEGLTAVATGDVVRVNESPLSATISVLDELTGPAVGIYSVYSLFRAFN